MNAYADLKTLKSPSYLNQDANGEDVYFRKLLEAASRFVEGSEMAGRKFYCWTGIRYYDGAGYSLWLPDDLLNITTLQLDEDGDGTYEATPVSTDYYEWPYNEWPKLRLDINPNGNYGGFAPGIRKGVKLTGTFGYADSATPYYNSGDSVQDAMTAIQTTVTVADVDLFSAGMTVLVESEQMYVTEVGATTLTVERGKNGTDATTHAKDKAIYIYTYPRQITQAVLRTAMRAWKRKDTAFQDVVGFAELGRFVAAKGIDPDVVELCKPFHRKRYM